jgi:hypothetical protein
MSPKLKHFFVRQGKPVAIDFQFTSTVLTQFACGRQLAEDHFSASSIPGCRITHEFFPTGEHRLVHVSRGTPRLGPPSRAPNPLGLT